MAPRNGGGPSSPWQRPSGIGNSRQQEPRPNSRGYSLPGGTSNNQNANRRPSSNPPSFAPPPSRHIQDRGDNVASYYRNDSRYEQVNSNHRNRDRERDLHYNNRRNPNEYRPNEFERSSHQARYDDRERNTNRGRGYENRPPIYDRRPMDESRNEGRYDTKYRDSRELSLYNNTANPNRRPVMGGGGSHYDEDRRRPIGRNDGNPGNGYRDSDPGGSFGRDYERVREQELRHNGDGLEYQRREPRPHIETNDFRDHHYRQQHDSDHYNSRYSTGREDRNNGGYHNSDVRRNEYNDRGDEHHQQPRQPEQRWQAPATTSRGDDYYETNNNGYNDDRADFTNHRTGMGNVRAGDSINVNHSYSERNLEGTERRSSEWARKAPPDEAKRSLTDGRGGAEEKAPAPVVRIQPRHIYRKKEPQENNDNDRKRQREDDRESSESSSSGNVPAKQVQKSSTSSSDTVETNPKQGPGESKKMKLSTSAATPSQTKINGKSSTKNIPVKAGASSLTKKHQIQGKPTPKPNNRLGIPMRWLKPKAKPKPPVKKVLPKVPEDTSKTVKIPSKQAARPSSPSNRLVTDSSEGGSIVSFKNNGSNNAKVTSSSSSSNAKKQKGATVPAAIVTKKKPKKASKPKSKPNAATNNSSITDYPEEEPEEEWDSDADSEESDGDASESDTDDDEVLDWASKMLGVPASPSSVQPGDSNDPLEPNSSQNPKIDDESKAKSPKLKIRLSSALKLKLTESKNGSGVNGLSEEDGNKLEAALKKLERRKKKREKFKALSEKIIDAKPEFDHEKAKMQIEEERRKREEAKPLTAKELREILRNDTFSGGGNQNNWVRRSRRQPNMALLNSKPVRILVDSLKYNDTDMRVLKMKKYINDPNTPCAVIDAVLNAMEENTNCEALYIQVRVF